MGPGKSSSTSFTIPFVLSTWSEVGVDQSLAFLGPPTWGKLKSYVQR